MNQKNLLGLNNCFLDVDDPFHLFKIWMDEAKKSEPNDPNAVALATSNKDNFPYEEKLYHSDFELHTDVSQPFVECPQNPLELLTELQGSSQNLNYD